MQPVDRNEIQAIRAELEGLRAQVDAVGSARRPLVAGRGRAPRPKLAKRLTRVGLVALMLALPVVVSASHQFTDVPTSHTFHAAIARLYGARLTTGCSAIEVLPERERDPRSDGRLPEPRPRSRPPSIPAGPVSRTTGPPSTATASRRRGRPLQHGGGPGGTGHRPGDGQRVGLHDARRRRAHANSRSGSPTQTPARNRPGHSSSSPTCPLRPTDGHRQWYEGTASVTYLFTVAFRRHQYLPARCGDPADDALRRATMRAPSGTSPPSTSRSGRPAEQPSPPHTQGVHGRRGH